MAINLGSLLQSIGVLPPQAGADLTVTGQPAKAPAPTPQLNTGSLGPIQATPQQIQTMSPLQGLPEHKGMFGLKGTLRDVLGTIGDAFLVQSGNKQIYRPQREQEKVSDALVGFTDGGKSSLDAINRVAQVNPALAQELYDRYLVDQNRRDTIEIQRGTQERQTAKDDRARRKEGGQLYAQALRGMGKDNYDPQVLSDIADEYGLPAGYDPPASYDERLAGRLISAGTPVNQQVTESLGTRRQNEVERANRVRESQGERRVANDTVRANRPPAGRAAPNPTAASMAANLIAKVQNGQSLTAGEEAALTRLGFPADRGSGRRRSRARAGSPSSGQSAPSTNNTPRRTVGGFSVERID